MPHMKYALERVDNLVLRTLHPSKIATGKLTVTEIKEIYAFTAAEHDYIIDQLKKDFFSLKEEKQLELYVQRYQSSIIHLADKLVHYIDEVNDASIQKLYKDLLNILESLLVFIENYFSKYFDLNAKIPESYRMLRHKEFQSDLLQVKMHARKFLHYPTLADIILESYNIYSLENKQKSITFRQLIYHKKLLTEIVKVLVNKKNKFQEEQLIKLLQYFNFNHNRFVYILTAKIALLVNELLSPSAKLDNLYLQVKYYNQLQTKPQYRLHPQHPDLRECCLNWLQEEIYFIEKKMQPIFIMPQVPQKEVALIETSLSVPQLALFIKLLIDTGIIKNQSYRNLTQMTAQYFKTKNAVNISSESLRLKAYAPDNSTKRMVKDTLLMLLNQVTKNFKTHIFLLNLFVTDLAYELTLLNIATKSLV